MKESGREEVIDRADDKKCWASDGKVSAYEIAADAG
jgi:hypothetical protein